VGGCASRVLQPKSRPEQQLRAAIKVAVAFEGDRIRRVEKGAEGADIIHEIVDAGKTVGKIILRQQEPRQLEERIRDKVVQGPDCREGRVRHLSTNKFAKDQSELYTFEDVILESPARVLVLAGIFRRQIVINHGLRISAVEHDKKSAGRCQTKCWRCLCARR
jgi:hypothetical protein